MSKQNSLTFLFPWLHPLAIKFVMVNNGIEVQVHKNNQQIKDRHTAWLRHVLPESLIKWIEAYHLLAGPQPYPLVKQLWQSLLPHASKKLLIDASALAELVEGSQPQDFALIWSINHTLERIEGHYEGADHYLGMGWFHKGTNLWSLPIQPSDSVDTQLKNLVAPLQLADLFLNSIFPGLRAYLPVRTNFQWITDFAVRVIAPAVSYGELTLSLQWNHPHIQFPLRIPQQQADILLAQQAIIRFPRQALSPVMMQLLQRSPAIVLRGIDVPLFIREQLPVMCQFRQISDEMAEQIRQANPMVPIAALKPVHSFIRTQEHGIGRYIMMAIYQYHQHTLDMAAFLTARQHNQRFVQQYGAWFEWPQDSHALAGTIQHALTRQVLQPEEVMGFDARRTALLQKQPLPQAIQPGGTTPVERSESLFKQLCYHGIPGGVIGEPKGLSGMFLKTCEYLLRSNGQARILWLAPPNKKGSVTRAMNRSTISSSVTVASPVTLQDEPGLLSHPWTLVIFQELDLLANSSLQRGMLTQLRWQWALTSVTSKYSLHPSIMQVLHLPELYCEQFCARYLFDLEKSLSLAPVERHISGTYPAQSAPFTVPKKPEILPLAVSSSSLQTSEKEKASHESVAFSSPVMQMPRIPVQANPTIEQPRAQTGLHMPAQPAPAPRRHRINLNQENIARLQKESEQLQKRLTVEEEEAQAEALELALPDATPELVPVTPVMGEAPELPPEVDEEWQGILQHWQPAHWEILGLLCQQKAVQLTLAERKNHRPVSQLIDEVNAPVDEQLGDLLIDPDTQTLAPHLRATAENLVSWYNSSH